MAFLKHSKKIGTPRVDSQKSRKHWKCPEKEKEDQGRSRVAALALGDACGQEIALWFSG